MHTKNDIITEALRLIGVTPSDQAVEPDDYVRADPLYDSAFEQLGEIHEIAVDFDADIIPAWAYEPLYLYMAGKLALTFSRPQFVRMEAKGLLDLRTYSALESRTDGRPHAGQYY